jgi:hypothetical protein|tara:strand:+ start:523 stop:1371 length:849 start_codon:yes stop_codon:yes gene_type:complete
MKLELKKFDPSSIANDSVVVFIGKRNTGKSYCMKDILGYHRDIPVGIVVSPTERANGYFEKFIPKMLLYDECEEKTIRVFLERQINISNERKRDMQKSGSTNIDSRAFLILDDCLYDKKWINDKSIRSIFMNGRHYKIFFLITMQHAMGLPPVLRNNLDYIFIFRNNIQKERMKIYENYAGMFANFEVFNQVMDQTTENYECLVIDCKTQSNKLEDQVYWYKAKETHYKMCSTELWNMQSLEEQRKEMGLGSETNEDDEPFDSGIFTKKSKNPRINVKKTSY